MISSAQGAEVTPASATPAGVVEAGASALVWRGWLAYVGLIYAYLYTIMLWGGPFEAFDHQNYIGFLDAPFAFFFEPLYTLVAYVLSAIAPPAARFPAVFIIFTVLPLVVVVARDLRDDGYGRGIMVFAMLLTKSFYIGFIAQRFFFAELWIGAAMIAAYPAAVRRMHVVFSGLIHFSALPIVAARRWMDRDFRPDKLLLAIAALVVVAVVLRVTGFRFLGYDYSRYLDVSLLREGFPIMSVIQLVVLGALCAVSARPDDRYNVISLVLVLVVGRVAFSSIEVFSRVFQLQVDFIITYVALNGLIPSLLFVYCAGFFLVQVFLSPTSAEVALYHLLAIQNAFARL